MKVFIFALCVLSFTLSGYAQSISSIELVNNAKAYDGKTVTYAGEAIGDIMRRTGGAWLNISDGSSAIGVWATEDLIREIIHSGSFKSTGDWVEVTGVFQRACNQHGGDLDIHAQAIRRISSGKLRIERLNTGKRNHIFILSGILCLILILRQLKRK